MRLFRRSPFGHPGLFSGIGTLRGYWRWAVVDDPSFVRDKVLDLPTIVDDR